MWFLYAFLFAVITSVSVIVAKRVMKNVDEYLYLAISNLFAVPFLFLIVVYFYEIPRVDGTFFRAIILGSIVGIFAAVFAYRAIKISEISAISPISAFNPVFTAVISFIFLHEVISGKSVFGILLICFGAYLLELSKAENDLLGPIKSLTTNPGVRLSLAAYFLWAITPVFEKTAILHTFPKVPPFVSLVGLSFTTVAFILMAIKKSKKSLPEIRNLLPIFLIVGVLGGLGQALAMVAFSLGELGLTTAVFKLSMIFTVVLGWILLKEQNVKDRLLGSFVMLLGVALLVV